MTVLNFAEKNRISKLISGFGTTIRTVSLNKCSFDTNWVQVVIRCYYCYQDFLIPVDMVKKNTWYSGMELNKEYTLEELGI